MEFAVNVPTSVGSSEYSTLPRADDIRWADQREYAQTLEALGYDAVAVPDHLMIGDGDGTMECTTLLAALAAATETVSLYPKTINNPLRHPPLLAKTMATLDVVSDGRLKLGIGAGWKADEAEAYGYDWPAAPDRLRELEETLEVLKGLWTNDRFSYDGDYVSVDDAACLPQPVQDPYPPLMVGGGGEEFTLRITAKHADCWNYWGPLDLMHHKLDVLGSHCETYGTDYDAIQKSWFARCIIREDGAAVESLLEEVPRFHPDTISETEYALVGTPEQVVADIERFQEIGINEVVVEFIDFPETTGAELFAEQVIPAFD